MDNNLLAEALFPGTAETPDFYENLYPPRNLPEGAVVSRLAPSPTGFVHLGNIIQGLTSERMSHQSGGVLFLRIEDTDAKREVKGGVRSIIEGLSHYGIEFDEGAGRDGDFGLYGPYRQRQRVKIYHCFAKQLVHEGRAYPCFCTEEELGEIRQKQISAKENIGYYGKWAVWRDKTDEEIANKLSSGARWVLRFRSRGDSKNKIKFTDLIKGGVEVTENDIDHVILKSDGIPTYHFAHAVDDHLMRTTHVVRGDEWLPSLPFHIQLFNALGFKLPKYLHIGPLMKMDGTSKRKLSKRKDKELALSFYREKGYPPESLYEYVLTVLNSNYEDWRNANPSAAAEDFKFSYKKMNPAGSLFDEAKLNDVSKNVVAMFSAEKVYNDLLIWADEFDPDFGKVLKREQKKAVLALAIGRGGKKPRKDFALWSEVKEKIGFVFDEYFSYTDKIEGFDKSDITEILRAFAKSYDSGDDREKWFEKIRVISEEAGFSPDIKEYKNNPSLFKGSVADVSSFIRVAVTGRLNSPDLYDIMKLLGKSATLRRITNFEEVL